MKHRARDVAVCDKILHEIGDIEDFLCGSVEEDFLHSKLLQKATVMSLLNIGELSKAYTDDFFGMTAQIPWHDIRSARNLAAHTYEAIDMRDVWETYRSDLPALRAEIEAALLKLLRGEGGAV